jgi:hypothetical protein
MAVVEVAVDVVASGALSPHPARRTIDAAAAAVVRMTLVLGRMGSLLSRGARGERVAAGCCQQPVLITMPLGQVMRSPSPDITCTRSSGLLATACHLHSA